MTDDQDLTPGGADASAQAETKNIFDQHEGTDWFLAWLIGFADLGVEQGMTLFVGGMMITGRLTSGRTYFAELAKLLHPGPKSTEGETPSVGESLSQSVEGFTAIYPPITEAAEMHQRQPSYIHLRGAKVFAVDGKHMPNRGTLWRGKLSAVDGFIVGELQPE